MHAGTMESSRFFCDGLPTGEVIVSDIREEVPESLVCSYFGKKSSKSGWDYRGHTTLAEQRAIKDLYFRVYDCPEPPNREITLAFARGLISMNLGRRVNWAQFSEERRKVREGLRKKAELRKEKKLRESENVDQESPTVLGKKRLSAGCPQQGFPETVGFLTPKSELALEGAAMVKKNPSRAGRHGVAPSWGPEEVDALVKVISSTGVLLQEATKTLEQGRAELVSVEDRLRRSLLLRSDRQAMLSDSKAQLVRLSEQERTFRSSLELKVARLRELEMCCDPISREEVKPVASEVSRLNAEIESTLFKKGLEEGSIRMYVTAIAGCDDTVAEMEATKLEMSAKGSDAENRVSSLKTFISAMEEQLSRMRAGDGAAFFPVPLDGCPQSPVVVTHTLNACPVCSLWFSCYDYSSLSCGHTYHPFCLYEHSQKSTACAVEVCQQQFGVQSLKAIGIRPAANTAASKRVPEKPRTASSNNPSLSGSGCEPTSSWEKEAPIQASQESEKKPPAAKAVIKDSSSEDLRVEEGAASEDNAGILGCTLCGIKEASVFIKPCGHDVFCWGCTQGLIYCPICRVKVNGWAKIKKAAKNNPFMPVCRGSTTVVTEVLPSTEALEGEGFNALSVDGTTDQDAGRVEADYDSSDSDEGTRTWCTEDVYLQGGKRSQGYGDAELSEERTGELGDQEDLSQGEAEMDDEERVPKQEGVPSMNKSLKRFAAVSDLLGAEPSASQQKRRHSSPISTDVKTALQDSQDAPKKRAVGRPAGKAGSRLNTGTRATSVPKDTSILRSPHALRGAGRKRDIKEIIPAKFR